MKTLKLGALLVVSFVAFLSVFYQINTRKPARGVVVGSAPEPKPGVAPGAAPAPQSAAASEDTNEGIKPEVVRGPAPQIPESGWGRNPFLTVDEINRMNQPEPVAIVAPPPRPQPVAPPALPVYIVTGIISGDQGKWAIVDGRLLRPGERIGNETLKEVKDRGVVLERGGQMRELPLRRLEDTAAAAPPKKETKQ
jgi:hypothetical protein